MGPEETSENLIPGDLESSPKSKNKLQAANRGNSTLWRSPSYSNAISEDPPIAKRCLRDGVYYTEVSDNNDAEDIL